MSHMNAFSKELDLKQQWNNSSGLPFNPNFSTAQAITALAALAIKNELFRKIVTTK
jgi:D-alanyl-D-alanine carboxypeptidase